MTVNLDSHSCFIIEIEYQNCLSYTEIIEFQIIQKWVNTQKNGAINKKT